MEEAIIYEEKSENIKIPISSERCIIFKFNKKNLHYLRDSYQKSYIRGYCEPNEIKRVIDDVEDGCDNFRTHHFYRKIIRTSFFFGFLIFLIGLGLIIAGIFQSRFNPPNQGPSSSVVYGLSISSLAFVLAYLVIIMVGHAVRDLSAEYYSKTDKVLKDYHDQFAKKKMRWRIGRNRLWLELWLDFNKEVLYESNYTSQVGSQATSRRPSKGYSARFTIEKTNQIVDFQEQKIITPRDARKSSSESLSAYISARQSINSRRETTESIVGEKKKHRSKTKLDKLDLLSVSSKKYSRHPSMDTDSDRKKNSDR